MCMGSKENERRHTSVEEKLRHHGRSVDFDTSCYNGGSRGVWLAEPTDDCKWAETTVNRTELTSMSQTKKLAELQSMVSAVRAK